MRFIWIKWLCILLTRAKYPYNPLQLKVNNPTPTTPIYFIETQLQSTFIIELFYILEPNADSLTFVLMHLHITYVD